MSVPAKYADQMFFVPKDQVRWISKDDFEVELEGLISELQGWVDARRKALLEEIKENKRKYTATVSTK